MTLCLSRYTVVDAINLWLKTGGPFLISGKVIDGRELTAKDLKWADGDIHVEVSPTKPCQDPARIDGPPEGYRIKPQPREFWVIGVYAYTCKSAAENVRHGFENPEVIHVREVIP